MTPTEATAAIERLVTDLARATGRSEKLIRLSYGLELDREVDAGAEVPHPAPREGAAA